MEETEWHIIGRDIGCCQSNVRVNGLEKERAKGKRETEKCGKMRQHTHTQAN